MSGTSRSVQINDPGTYVVQVRAMDNQLRMGPRYNAVVVVGNVTEATPPNNRAIFGALSGVAPFSFNIDMSASDDGGDGLGLTSKPYCYQCGTGWCSFEEK